MPRKSRSHSVAKSRSPSITESKLQDQEFSSYDERCSTPSDEKRSEEEPSTQRWRASEPPEETFSEAEQNEEWLYDIIGEDVDQNGTVMLEVRWDDWTRADGTKTTWIKATDGYINCDNWSKTQQNLRHNMAKESLEIRVISTVDVHNTETYLRSKAYAEKLKRARSTPQPNLMLELARLQEEVAQAETSSDALMESQGSSMTCYPIRNNQRASTRQKTEISLANSSPSKGSKFPARSSGIMNSTSDTLTSTPFSSPLSSPETTISRLNVSPGLQKLIRTDNGAKCKGKQTVFHIKEEENVANSSSSEITPKFLRSQLHKLWTRIAAREKAAPIYFTNTVDAEPVPPLSLDFLYLESKYKFAPGVTDPSGMGEFLVKCSNNTCDVAAVCECQHASTLVNGMGEPMLAYTPEGYFAFNVPKGTEVVECNKLCECSLKTCPNRVSQRPRDVPIEVFKTASRGWGVRSLVDVKRGKVLGLYTGLVVPRDFAHSHPDHTDSEYIFDLDGDENDEDVPVHHTLYSVDSKSSGNWTRFINHSCSPTLGIYLVVHDTPPANGLPFIAFVATKDLPAKTEFTVDYNPRAAERFLTAQGGRNQRRELTHVDESRPCKCGSDVCRGYLT